MGSFLLGGWRVLVICLLPHWLPCSVIFLSTVFLLEQTVKHLSEAHLPKSSCPDGILRVKIPGWCAGAHVQHGLDKPGYIFFLREGVETGALKSLRITQQDDIVLPFLEENRQATGWQPATPIPEHLRGCYMMDAEMNQIAAVTMDQRSKTWHDSHKLSVAM
jgi:hypothetical protein